MRGRPRATVIRTDTTMTSKIARPLDLLRLVGGVVLLVLGLIAVVPSPNDWVWLLGVLVTEGGHWALVACLPLFAPGWRPTRLSRPRAGRGPCAFLHHNSTTASRQISRAVVPSQDFSCILWAYLAHFLSPQGGWLPVIVARKMSRMTSSF